MARLLLKNYKFCLVILIVLVLIIIISFTYANNNKTKNIVEEFNKNFQVFNDVEQYASETDDYLVFYKDGKKIVGYSGDNRNQVGDAHIAAQAGYILTNLKYKSIEEQNNPELKGAVVFERVTRNGYEQGIVYLDNDDGKYGMVMEKIRDHWYYYAIGYY